MLEVRISNLQIPLTTQYLSHMELTDFYGSSPACIALSSDVEITIVILREPLQPIYQESIGVMSCRTTLARNIHKSKNNNTCESEKYFGESNSFLIDIGTCIYTQRIDVFIGF